MHDDDHLIESLLGTELVFDGDHAAGPARSRAPA